MLWRRCWIVGKRGAGLDAVVGCGAGSRRSWVGGWSEWPRGGGWLSWSRLCGIAAKGCSGVVMAFDAEERLSLGGTGGASSSGMAFFSLGCGELPRVDLDRCPGRCGWCGM